MGVERPTPIIPDRLRYERRLLTRRALLRRGGIAALGLTALPTLLTACGGDDDGGGGEAAGGGETGAAAPQASGTLDFLSWEGYDFPVDSMEAWKKDNGVTLKTTYIGNHDDIQAKIKGGGGEGVDLITYYQGYKALYSELEILTPLDESKLPNLQNLFPFFASDEGNYWVDPDGTRTGVPMFWGSLGLTYDAAVVPEPPTTYDVVFEPEWKGKLAVVEDPVGLYTHVGHILGFNIVELTEDQLQQVNDYLRRMLGQSKGVSASYGDATTRLVSGDAVFAFPGWYAVNQFARDAGKDTVQSTLPEEGGYSFCDSYAIPPTADNVDSAHAWINQGLDPVANAEAANYLVGGTTCEASVEFLSDEVKELYSYDNLDEIVAKAPFYPNPPIESDEFVTMEQVLGSWQELKATA